MNVLWKWLLEYVRYDGPRDMAIQRMTMAGLNVDDVQELTQGDALLDVEVTSNRPDCLGYMGIARELAALTDSEFVTPDAAIDQAAGQQSPATVEVTDASGCPRYTARLIRGVRIGPSPAWLAARLEAIGLRSVNNVVDVTNYVMYECGQPLHAFDYNLLDEGRIIVRRASEGEAFEAIDHSQHKLKSNDLVIADASGPVALAGIMGGVRSEVSEQTVDVLLEAAIFDPLSVRTTSRRVQLMSDSSYRFERRVDYDGVAWASQRACSLIQQVAGGQVVGELVDVAEPQSQVESISFRFGQLPRVLGIEVPEDEVLRILSALGCQVQMHDAGFITVVPPTFRRDLSREIDLLEEVARIYGYDKIPYLSTIPSTAPVANQQETITRLIQDTMVAAGYHEALSHTLVDAESAAMFGAGRASAPLVTRLTLQGVAYIRKSVLSGLLQAKRVNQDIGHGKVDFFEIARAFRDNDRNEGDSDLPHEEMHLALVTDEEPLLGKGTLELLLERLGLAERLTLKTTERVEELDPQWQADVLLDGQVIGFCGLLNKATAEKFKFRRSPWVAEIDILPLIDKAQLSRRFEDLPQYPAMERDLALVVDEAVSWDQVAECVQSAGLDQLEAVEFLSLYRGEQIPPERKCLALRMRFRSADRTLTHEEADRFQQQVLQCAGGKLGATLRT